MSLTLTYPHSFWVSQLPHTFITYHSFRRQVWSRLKAEALKDLLPERFSPLSKRQLLACLEQRELGTSRLRFLPKLRGMRPIVNLGKPSTIRFKGLVHQGRIQQQQGGGGGDPRWGSKVHVGAKRKTMSQPLCLSFKPVNVVLQGPYHVSVKV
jgi:hypothetical protein